MAGRNGGGAGSRSRSRGGRLAGRVSVACPQSWPDRIEREAEAEDMTPAEWLRRTIRRALSASRKRRAREAAKAAT